MKMTAIQLRPGPQRELGGIYTQYERMIHDRALHYATSFGREKNDLLSIGNFVFMRAWHKWDKKRGVKFGTYLYRALCNAMQDFCRGVDSPPDMEVQDAACDVLDAVNPSHIAQFRDALNNLSLPAKMIAQLVLCRPGKTLNIQGDESAHVIRIRIQNKLVKKGWTDEQIRTAFNELREMTKESYT